MSIYSLAILAISLSSTMSTTTSNLLSQSIKDPFHLDQINLRWLDEDSQNDDDTTNCKSPILDSYDDNVTCVDASGSDRIGNGTIFIGNSVTSTDGIAVDSYRGIKYATQERFTPSEIFLADGEINATEYGDDCAQQLFLGTKNKQSIIEDCLYLNIWKPSTANDDDPLPVMVWVHGGGFVVLSGSVYEWNPANIAGNEDVIVVSLNYRLGIFGFMPTSTDGTGGMNGILDQVQALEWVQHYISFFGGDQNRVTIFGESAGADSVGILSVLPQANGLFNRAIAESGKVPPRPLIDANISMEIVETVLGEIDCSMPPCTVSDLQNLPVKDLLNFSVRFGDKVTFDSTVLPTDLHSLYLAGAINPTDMIIGGNTYNDNDIGSLTPNEYIKMANTGIAESSCWNKTVADNTSNEERQAAVNAYSIDRYNGSHVAAFAQFQGDFIFTCPNRDFAETIASKVDGKIYNYLFGYLSDYDIAKISGLLDEANITDPTWTGHSFELPFVFGNPGWTSQPLPFSDKDKSVSKEIMSRWANFARSGNPSASTDSASSEEWVPISSDSSSDDGDTTATATATADPRYMYFTGDGGTMIESNPQKMEQCASIPLPFKGELNNNSSSSNNKNDNNNNNNATNENMNIVASDDTGNYTNLGSSSSSSDSDSSSDSSSNSSSNMKVGAGNNMVFTGQLVVAVLLQCMMMMM